MAAAGAARALDIPEKQALINFDDDANGLRWHHRILLIKGGDGRWVVATPTWGIQIADLTRHQIRVLRRGAPVDREYLAEAFLFDPNATDAELARARAEALELAEIAGFDLSAHVARPGAAAALADAVWRIADTGSVAFSEEIPAAAMRDRNASVIKDSVALICLDGRWTYAEKVVPDKCEEWLRGKRAGPGRDPRLLGDVRDRSGQRFVEAPAALKLMKRVKQPVPVLDGPPALEEYAEGLTRVGFNFVTHNLDWEVKSGVAPRGGVAREHKFVSTWLYLLLTTDQLDISNLISAELAARRLIQIEAAVRRNPKAPDFDGLDMIMATPVGPGGEVITRDFTKWVAERQKDEGFLMKQQRLLREERAADDKRQRGGKGGDKGPKAGANAAGPQ